MKANYPPVLLIVFNRPDLTRQIVNELRKSAPPLLYVAADGPRPDNETDTRNCHLVRKEIEGIDWQCELIRMFQDQNQGCGCHIAGAISHVLKQHDRVIVLEDDCLPSPSFIPFCRELLEQYQDDKRVSMICGSLPVSFPEADASYFFSTYYSCWGWATWRRAWKTFDFNMVSWPHIKTSGLVRSRFATTWEYRSWARKNDIYALANKVAWARQWGLAARMAGGLALFSTMNLITNRGIGHDAATHSRGRHLQALYSSQPHVLAFPLTHPAAMLPDIEKEWQIRKTVAASQPFRKRCRRVLRMAPSFLVDVRELLRDYWSII